MANVSQKKRNDEKKNLPNETLPKKRFRKEEPSDTETSLPLVTFSTYIGTEAANMKEEIDKNKKKTPKALCRKLYQFISSK